MATTRWPLLLNYTQTGNTKIQKKSFHTFCVFKDFSSFPIGVDRTFNLGTFFATTLVYKNQRVTRKETKDHSIFAGPMLLHKDASYQTYRAFLSPVCRIRA